MLQSPPSVPERGGKREKPPKLGEHNNEPQNETHPRNRRGAVACGRGSPMAAEKLTIATVNNGDMITMQKLSSHFESANPDIELEWLVLEEGVLRQRVTQDIAAGGGQFDIMTIGAYETPLWGKKGWLTPLDDFGADYDYDDMVPSIRSALSVDGKLYAAPFYAESSFLMYRADLFEKAGLTMPDRPTYAEVRGFAADLHDPGQATLRRLRARKARMGRQHGLCDHRG